MPAATRAAGAGGAGEAGRGAGRAGQGAGRAGQTDQRETILAESVAIPVEWIEDETGQIGRRCRSTWVVKTVRDAGGATVARPTHGARAAAHGPGPHGASTVVKSVSARADGPPDWAEEPVEAARETIHRVNNNHCSSTIVIVLEY